MNMQIKFNKKIEKTNNNLKFGDLVFCDSRQWWNLFAHAIRYVERGGKIFKHKFTPNHVMMVIEENPDIDKVKIIEASLFIHIRPLKNWLNNRKLNIIIKRYKKDLRHKSREKMHTYALQQLGGGYDFGAIAGILGRYIALKYVKSRFVKWLIGKRRNPLSSRKRFICSEFMYLIYIQARIKLWRKCHYTNVTPFDEYRNKNFYRVYKKINYEYPKPKGKKK